MLIIYKNNPSPKDKYVLHKILQFGDFEVEHIEEDIGECDNLAELINYCIINNYKLLEKAWGIYYITYNDKSLSNADIINYINSLSINNKHDIIDALTV